jgi:hypothetical protein
MTFSNVSKEVRHSGNILNLKELSNPAKLLFGKAQMHDP